MWQCIFMHNGKLVGGFMQLTHTQHPRRRSIQAKRTKTNAKRKDNAHGPSMRVPVFVLVFVCVCACVCVYLCVHVLVRVLRSFTVMPCAGCRLIYWRFVLCPLLRWCSLALWAFILAVIIRHLGYTSSGSCSLSLSLARPLPSLSTLKSVKQLSVFFLFFFVILFLCYAFFF